MSADQERASLIRSLCIAFDSKVDFETVNNLLAQHDNNIELVVDHLLSKAETKAVSKEQPTTDSLFSSVLNEVDISQSTLNVIQKVGRTAQEEESNAKSAVFFDERIESLSRQLAEAIQQKARVEEEKRNALKWCVKQVNAMKEEIKQKDELLEAKDKELRKQLEPTNLDERKTKIAERILTHITDNITKIQQEFEKTDLESDAWAVVIKGIKKLQELYNRISSTDVTLSPDNSKIVQEELYDDKEMWKAEKTSLESYIKELENRLAYYEEAQEK